MKSTSLPRPPPTVRLRRGLRQLHRWLGLLVGAQLLLWVFGGLVMSALRLDSVRGADYAAEDPAGPLDAGQALFDIGQLLAGAPAATQLTLHRLLGQPVYRLDGPAEVRLFDAVSGQLLSPLDQDHARQLALADYRGPGQLAGVDWLDQPSTETRGRELPLWRARFADPRDTTLYISPYSGDVVARRNALWRAFDWVWMLHIMDYRDRDNFNHPLLVATAGTTLLFVLSGVGMLGFSFWPKRR